MSRASLGAAGAALLLAAGLVVVDRKVGLDALVTAATQLGTMLSVLPPVFVLIGLLDVWVDRGRVASLLGVGTGARGAILALVLGSLAAGPVYAAFPAAAVLLGKGSTLANALAFVGAWSTTKLPMVLFEASALGWKITLARLAIDVPGVLAIAWLTARTVPSASACSESSPLVVGGDALAERPPRSGAARSRWRS